MPSTHTSDFETLVQKCATDLKYRASLAAALKDNNDAQIRKLLQDIGVNGGGDRLNALRAGYAAMDHIAAQFTTPDIVPAP